MTEYTLNAYPASKKKNLFMKGCDLNPDYKIYIIDEPTRMTVKDLPTEEKISKFIELSKEYEDDIWFPIIVFQGKIYAAPGIKEVSNGKSVKYLV